MKPSTIIFDVNETLSDMSPMGQRFVEVGAPAHLAKLWFATLLRDGFALTAAGDKGTFAGIGAEALRGTRAAGGPTLSGCWLPGPRRRPAQRRAEGCAIRSIQ